MTTKGPRKDPLWRSSVARERRLLTTRTRATASASIARVDHAARERSTAVLPRRGQPEPMPRSRQWQNDVIGRVATASAENGDLPRFVGRFVAEEARSSVHAISFSNRLRRTHGVEATLTCREMSAARARRMRRRLLASLRRRTGEPCAPSDEEGAATVRPVARVAFIRTEALNAFDPTRSSAAPAPRRRVRRCHRAARCDVAPVGRSQRDLRFGGRRASHRRRRCRGVEGVRAGCAPRASGRWARDARTGRPPLGVPPRRRAGRCRVGGEGGRVGRQCELPRIPALAHDRRRAALSSGRHHRSAVHRRPRCARQGGAALQGRRRRRRAAHDVADDDGVGARDPLSARRGADGEELQRDGELRRRERGDEVHPRRGGRRRRHAARVRSHTPRIALDRRRVHPRYDRLDVRRDRGGEDDDPAGRIHARRRHRSRPRRPRRIQRPRRLVRDEGLPDDAGSRGVREAGRRHRSERRRRHARVGERRGARRADEARLERRRRRSLRVARRRRAAAPRRTTRHRQSTRH